MHETALVEALNVSKHYPRGRELVRALDNVSLRIDAGEYVAVVGPSGSGKSTLLNVIGAMDHPTDGRLRVAGNDLTSLDDRGLTRLRATTVGFVFQEFFLQPTLTALENVLLPTVFHPRKDARARAAELLERVGLTARASHLPHELSGGEMQRVAIARSLVNNPRLLLADEPTGNLDSENAQQIYALLDDLHREGRAVVVVTHSEDLALRASRRIDLRDGRVCQDTQQR